MQKKTTKKVFYIALLLVFILIGLKFYGYQTISKLEKENRSFEEKIEELNKEILKLKETANYSYKLGIDLLDKKEYAKALTEFENVIKKYPKSKLIRSAREKIAYIKKKQKKIKAAKLKKEKERIEREKYRVRTVREAVDQWQKFTEDIAGQRGVVTTWKFKCVGYEYIKTVEAGGYPYGYVDYKKLKVVVLGLNDLSYEKSYKQSNMPRIDKGNWIIVTGSFSFASNDKRTVYLTPIKIINKGYKG